MSAGVRRRRGCLQAIEFAGLRDVPVLAELAGEIAARGAERQYRGAGQEVIQRLLLDRVDAKAAGPPVGRQQHLVIAVGSHEAEPALARVQFAVPGAKVALQPAVLQPVPVAGGFAPYRVHSLHSLRLCIYACEAARNQCVTRKVTYFYCAPAA
jgi:hypothetical protein